MPPKFFLKFQKIQKSQKNFGQFYLLPLQMHTVPYACVHMKIRLIRCILAEVICIINVYQYSQSCLILYDLYKRSCQMGTYTPDGLDHRIESAAV